MGLERLLRTGLTHAALLVALGTGTLSCTGPEEEIPQFDVKYAMTDANGVARFVDKQAGEISVSVLDGDGARSSTEGALVTLFDGEGSNAVYAQHPDYDIPDFQVFSDEDLVNASLTVSSVVPWQGWALVGSSAEHNAARDLVTWATEKRDNGWGYYGCSTFHEIELGHRFGSVLYAGAQRLAPVAAVNSLSQSMTRVWEILAGQGDEGIEDFEAEECEAFQFFGFIPNYDGWTSPTGGMVIPFCYTPTETEIYLDNGVDDDCNGFIDEGGPVGDDDDFGDDDDSSPGDDDDSTPPVSSCTGSEYLCDDFEDESFNSSLWNIETGSVEEREGKLFFDSNSTVSSRFPISVGPNQYSFTLLSELVTGYNSSVRLEDDYNGWVRFDHYQGSVSASCKPGYGDETIFEGDTTNLQIGTEYDLEISAYGGRTSIFVNNQIILNRDTCFGGPGDTSIELRLSNGTNEALVIERIEVDEL